MRVPAASRTLLLVMSLVACDGDDNGAPPADTPPATSPTAITTEHPSTRASLRLGDAVPIPENVALTIQTGCWQCDGPITGFVRLRRLPNGSLEELQLFSPKPYGIVTGFGFDTGGTGAVAISTCRLGCDGFNPATGEEQTAVHESRDGGLQYTVGPPLNGWYSVAGANSGSALISGPATLPEPLPLRRMREDTLIVPPPGGFNPYVLSAEVVWTTQNRDTLLSADGATLVATPGEQIVDVTELIHAGRLAVLSFSVGDTQGRYIFRILDRGGTSTSVERTFDGGQFILIGSSLDECAAIGNADVPLDFVPTPESGRAFAGFLPAVIDFCEGVIHPIMEPFTREPYFNGRNLVEFVQQGPFVSIASDVGNCLNVRTEPSGDAESLGCFVAGVLLFDRGESQPGGTQTWRRVLAPAGAEGWASEEFLGP